MKKNKKMLSWVSLGVLLLSNVITPWTYAEIEMDENENFDILGDILENYEGIDDENGVDEDNHEVLDLQSDINGDENFYGENSLQRENDSYLILTKDENLALNTNESDIYDWKDCYDYEYNDVGTLSISNYKCDSRNIIIPTSEYGNDKNTSILNGTFAGKIIESIEMPEKFSVHYEAFSGAIFSGNITLEEKNSNQQFNTLYSITVSEGSTLTLKQPSRLYMSTINGKLIYDLNNVITADYILNRGIVNGEVEIKGLNGSLNRSFQNANISENGRIVLGDGITKIDNCFVKNSIYNELSYTNGIIVLPETLEDISDSFTETVLGKSLSLPKSINNVYNSFRESELNSDFFFTSDNVNNEFHIDSSFGYSIVGGNLVFSGLNMSLDNVSPAGISGDFSFINVNFTNINNLQILNNGIISGNVDFVNTNLNLNGGYFFNGATILGNFNMNGETIKLSSGIPSSLKIYGDLNISGSTLKLPGFSATQITGNVNIIGDSLDFQYGFSNSAIKGNLTIKGDSIIAKYGSLNDMTISGNFLISGSSMEIESSVLERLKVGGDFIIDTESLSAKYGVISSMTVLGDLKFPDNVIFGPGVLQGSVSKGRAILNFPKKDSLLYSIQGDLIILDSDNASAEEFSGISVRNNIYLSGEISKVGVNAYKFSSGNIQPITLSATFSTGDIGEGAFCMEGKPLVVAYTKKKLTQAEKEYLRTHACLNAMGTYILTFKSGDRTETLEYDGRNINQIPVRERTGYEFLGWHETGTNEIFDFTGTEILEDKTFYAKWKANTYAVSFDTNGGNEISPISVDCDTLFSGVDLPKPTRECNEFSGWENLPEIMPAHDITLKAMWEYTCSKSSGGGGAKKTESTTRETAVETPTENEHNSADEQKSDIPETSNTPANEETTSNQVISVTQEVSEDGTIEAVVETIKIKNTDIVATVRTEVNSTNSSSRSSSSATHTKEENDAYSFAKSNGITTTSSIDDAKMNTELTRIQMAKMLSNFAINVLGQEPDPEKGIVKFDDVTNKMDKQYDNAVTKAYQLGIMGQNVKNNEFRPNDTVTRAEFASALSRLLYHTEEGNYKGTGKYYVPHVAKLYNEGIINKADPKIKEKRGYVMTMLMRTVE